MLYSVWVHVGSSGHNPGVVKVEKPEDVGAGVHQRVVLVVSGDDPVWCRRHNWGERLGYTGSSHSCTAGGHSSDLELPLLLLLPSCETADLVDKPHQDSSLCPEGPKNATKPCMGSCSRGINTMTQLACPVVWQYAIHTHVPQVLACSEPHALTPLCCQAPGQAWPLLCGSAPLLRGSSARSHQQYLHQLKRTPSLAGSFTSVCMISPSISFILPLELRAGGHREEMVSAMLEITFQFPDFVGRTLPLQILLPTNRGRPLLLPVGAAGLQGWGPAAPRTHQRCRPPCAGQAEPSTLCGVSGLARPCCLLCVHLCLITCVFSRSAHSSAHQWPAPAR